MALDSLTLPELRLALAPGIAAAAAFDGWAEAAIDAAAAELGVAPAAARLAFPGGAPDMIAAWIERIDADAALALPQDSLAALRVPERIRRLVEFRIDAVAGREEALRRALAILALPQNLTRAAKLGWGSADLMWRLAGDTATDFNHYTKRTILSGIVAATLAVLIDDASANKAETRAFLGRRLQDVARFEKAKAQIVRPDAEHFSLIRLLGRLRYPAR